MNELMVVVEGQQWLYYKTDENDVSRAFSQFCECCDNNGINLDNLSIVSVKLRDQDGETIGTIGTNR